ncbi:MAG: hypothetical protein LC808_31130, partial [Actinobacteria bacterium]|nr:hypothetical protein [Actinomycetota bacterium]
MASPTGSTATPTAQLHETAKWIVAAFAAIGGLLIAGIQLPALGQLEVGWGLVSAGLAMAVALAAVGWVIFLATDVLTNRYSSLREVDQARLDSERKLNRRARRRLGSDAAAIPAFIYASGLFKQLPRDASYLFQDTEADDLAELYSLQTETHRILDGLLVAPSVEDRDGRLWTSSDVADLQARAEQLDKAATRVVEYANDFTTRRAFRNLRRRIIIAGAVAAVAVSVFAWLVNPKTRPVAEIQAPLPV